MIPARQVVRGMVVVLFPLIGLACSGCGSSSTVSPDEEQAISLVLDVSDATRSDADFAALFATGRAPAKAERRKYAEFSFSPIGLPTVAGEEVTFTVAVTDAQDNAVGETAWTAVKEQGKWKLSSAPLP